MNSRRRSLALGLVAAGLVSAAPAFSQGVGVTFSNGLLSVRAHNAPLSEVFEQIERAAGVELIVEDAVKSKRLDADLAGVPVAMAVQRLLEGQGVNYAVMMDPRDWGRVDKIFVGAGGGGPSRPAPPPRRPVVRPAPDPVDDFDDVDDMDAMDDFDDVADDVAGDELDAEPGALQNPPGSSPLPSYLPPQQSFPRSTFTPGPPGAATTPPGQTPANPGNPSAPPPATFPFMDALGRPIPIPPDMQRQQQEQRRRKQQQQQQN